jgi:hypothetical protein
MRSSSRRPGRSGNWELGTGNWDLGPLSAQQRLICRCHQILRCHRIRQLGVGGADRHRLAVGLATALSHADRHALGDQLGHGGVAVGEDRGELVSTPAEAVIVQAHLVAERGRDLAQAVVAGEVPVAVVDLLESVEVGQQQAQRRAKPARAGDLHRKRLIERAPVAEPGERIGTRERLRLEATDPVEPPVRVRHRGHQCQGRPDDHERDGRGHRHRVPRLREQRHDARGRRSSRPASDSSCAHRPRACDRRVWKPRS